MDRYIKRIVNEGGDNNFVIFEDKNTGKFIQYAGTKGDPVLICDIPFHQLTPEEEDALIEMGFTKGEISYQALVDYEDAAELADEIFTEIFNLQDYKLKVELNLE